MQTGITCLLADRKPHPASSINPLKKLLKAAKLKQRKDQGQELSGDPGGGGLLLYLGLGESQDHPAGAFEVQKDDQDTWGRSDDASSETYKFGGKTSNLKFRAQF